MPVQLKNIPQGKPSDTLAPSSDLHVSVSDLPLCVPQLSLSGFQALLQRLHLPLQLLLVLFDGHVQLAKLNTTGCRERGK